MRVFVTGASGFIGSAVVPELLAAGHQVVALARSDASAAALTATGAKVHRGSLDDVESLRAGAAACDGVIHLAYNHDFSDMAAAGQADLRAIQTFGDVFEGSGRPLVFAAGLLGLASGSEAAEKDVPDPASFITAGRPGSLTVPALVERGVHASVVRLALSVHDETKSGFAGNLVDIARAKGVSGYIGDGANRWPTVHRQDAARLFRMALEKAPAGSVLHGVGEQGVATREIAEAIGRGLDLPVASVPADQAGEHFGWLAMFFGDDVPASSNSTREILGWVPTGPGLIDDLDKGRYFES